MKLGFTERVTYIYSLPLQSIRVKSWWLILQYRFHQHPMNHHSRDRIALAWVDHQTYPTLFNSTQNIIYFNIFYIPHAIFCKLLNRFVRQHKATVGKCDPLLILYVFLLTTKWSVYNLNGRFIWTVKDRITTKIQKYAFKKVINWSAF